MQDKPYTPLELWCIWLVIEYCYSNNSLGRDVRRELFDDGGFDAVDDVVNIIVSDIGAGRKA
jgi:hypothetical protein